MGLGILGDVLRNVASYEPDMVVCVPDNGRDVDMFAQVLILQHGAHGDEDTHGYPRGALATWVAPGCAGARRAASKHNCATILE